MLPVWVVFIQPLFARSKAIRLLRVLAFFRANYEDESAQQTWPIPQRYAAFSVQMPVFRSSNNGNGRTKKFMIYTCETFNIALSYIRSILLSLDYTLQGT
ncbi:hypothetical protein BELL_0736g00020 [Botrytis elliptica]|uniref:Uncharacterized protein n=1 Tax=Botrytis elliptica TaxID=278938 RepID=A0A4Z1J952_9HELO|nr:hypothetical protein BELL_0736g00020 [Botrytis elliptica]